MKMSPEMQQRSIGFCKWLEAYFAKISELDAMDAGAITLKAQETFLKPTLGN